MYSLVGISSPKMNSSMDHDKGNSKGIHGSFYPQFKCDLQPILCTVFHIRMGTVHLVGGIPTPLKNMTLSVRMMKFPIYGRIIQMFQTTNQYFPNYPLVN